MVDYARRLKRILKDHGWALHRQAKGDHEIWKHEETGRTVSIDAKTRSRHLANDILKELGIGKKF